MQNSTLELLEHYKLNGKKILVDFWGPWCSPCKRLIPVLETLETDYSDVVFIKIDITLITNDVINMGISSVPTVLIYNGTDLVSNSIGVKSESFYRDELNKLNND